MKNWKTILYILAIAPLLYTFLLFIFYIHSTIELGFFPKYNNPDPKQVTLYHIYEPIIVAVGSIGLISLILWIPLVLIYWIRFNKRTKWKPVIYGLFSFLIAILSIFTSITEWFAD